MVASVLLAALWGASLGASQDAASDFVTLGTVRIGGTDGQANDRETDYLEWTDVRPPGTGP